jgi:hypothetical protein
MNLHWAEYQFISWWYFNCALGRDWRKIMNNIGKDFKGSGSDLLKVGLLSRECS